MQRQQIQLQDLPKYNKENRDVYAMRRQEIFRMYTEDGLTLVDIAGQTGLTAVRVGQIVQQVEQEIATAGI